MTLRKCFSSTLSMMRSILVVFIAMVAASVGRNIEQRGHLIFGQQFERRQPQQMDLYNRNNHYEHQNDQNDYQNYRHHRHHHEEPSVKLSKNKFGAKYKTKDLETGEEVNKSSKTHVVYHEDWKNKREEIVIGADGKPSNHLIEKSGEKNSQMDITGHKWAENEKEGHKEVGKLFLGNKEGDFKFSEGHPLEALMMLEAMSQHHHKKGFHHHRSKRESDTQVQGKEGSGQGQGQGQGSGQRQGRGGQGLAEFFSRAIQKGKEAIERMKEMIKKATEAAQRMFNQKGGGGQQTTASNDSG